MKIGIPVKCQNGHKATWVVEFRGLDAVSLGVDHVGKCKCPKHEIGQGYFPDGEPFLLEKTAASRDVLAERARQVSVEGWTPQHDDEHDSGDLAAAASAYALYTADELSPHSQGDWAFGFGPPEMWPFHLAWWKPEDPRRALVKAGALILAEIERIDRAGAQGVQS